MFCQSNPINRVDPSGQADYFNENGVFLYRDQYDDGDIRIIKQEDYDAIVNDVDTFEINLVIYSSQAVESYNLGLITDEGLIDVANFYNKVGVPITMGTGKFQMEANNKTSDQHFQVEVNVSGCVNNNFYDSYYNLDNAINGHEGYHIKEMKKDPWKYDKTPKVKREARAYKAQMESPSWEKTT